MNNQSKIDKVFRVFFHELGHFVASQIEFIRKYGPGVNEISIHPCKEDREEYCGCTKFINSELGQKEKLPLDRLPQYFAANAYGGFFQAYWSGKDLQTCRINCDDDRRKTENAIKRFAIPVSMNDITSSEEIFFSKLLQGNYLKDFLSLKPKQYLKPCESNCYLVDIDKLKFDTCDIVNEHMQLYDSLIQEYVELLNPQANTSEDDIF